MNEIPDDIKIALEAAGESAQRCRWVMLALVTGSVLAFFALWNSFEQTWVRVRHRKLDELVRYWYDGKNSTNFIEAKDFVNVMFKAGSLYGDNDKPAGKALLTHLTQLRDDIEKLHNQEGRYVRVAFFGIGFDINDLGVFASVGFCVLLAMLGFSLKREVRNLTFYFELLQQRKPPDEKRKEFGLNKLGYNLLAMRQVLTMPAAHSDHEVNIGWRILQWFPLGAPLAIQAWIVGYDIDTFEVGRAWDPSRMLELIIFDASALVVVAIFTAVCVWERNAMNKVWENAYRESYKKGSMCEDCKALTGD